MATLLDQRHPEYKRMRPLWDFTRAHYDDRYLYWELDQSGDVDLLPRKTQGEHPKEYEERKKLAAYANVLGPILDSFVGLLFNKEEEAERDWGALGNPQEEPESLAALIQEDADRSGTDHEAQLKQVATDLLQFQKTVLLVDTNRTDAVGELSVAEARARGIRPGWKRISPQSLVNWRKDADGRIVEALLKEKTDARESLGEDSSKAEAEVFIHFQLTPGDEEEQSGRWRRLIKDSDADTGMREIASSTFDYEDPQGRPDIPVFVTSLPVTRYPAHTLARLANRIFNLESAGIHWPIRKAGFAKLVLSGQGIDDIKQQIRDGGANILPENMTTQEGGKGHRFIAPSMDEPQAAAEEREKLMQQFWKVAQFEFSDQAAERTATEIRADFVASIGSFLNVLAGALDEAEQRVLFLLEQAAGEDSGEASVQRTRDFGVEDGIAIVQRLGAVFFGERAGVPLPPEVEADLVVKMLEKAGLEIEEEEADAIMREAETRADQQRLFQDAVSATEGQTPEQELS